MDDQRHLADDVAGPRTPLDKAEFAWGRYLGTKELESLRQARLFCEQALAANGSEHPTHNHIFVFFIQILCAQFQDLKDEQALELAVERIRNELPSFSGPEPWKWHLMQTLARLLEARIDFAAKQNNLSRALPLAEAAIAEIPNSHPNHTRLLFSLSNVFRLKYEQKNDIGSLSQAIQWGEKTLTSARPNASLGPTNKFAMSERLRQSLEQRYKLHHENKDLERLISLAKDETLGDCPVWKATCKSALAKYISWKYVYEGGSIAHLDRAIELGISFQNIPRGNPGRLEGLDGMIQWHCWRYENNGKEEELSKAMALVTDETAATPPGEPLPRLYNVNILRMQWYNKTGNTAYLDEAAKDCREALKTIHGDEYSLHTTLLADLGCILRMRYERDSDSDDLQEALEKSTAAVERNDPSGRIFQKTNLALCHAQVYACSRHLENLVPVIKLGREAAAETPPGHADRFKTLQNLSIWLAWSYEMTKKPSELDESIDLSQKALELAPLEHVVRHLCLIQLSIFFVWRYEATESLDDLESSISYGRQAVKGIPPDHPDRVRALYALFESLRIKYEKEKSAQVRAQATRALTEVMTAEASPPTHRLNMLFHAIPWLEAHGDWPALSQITEKATALLACVSLRSLRQTDQQFLLRRYAGLSSKAAAVALQIGTPKEDALWLLELGRGVITSLLLQNRQDITLLRHKYPAWSQQFEELKDVLDPPMSITAEILGGQEVPGSKPFFQEKRRQAADELSVLLGQIRKDEDLKSFLLPPSPAELKNAAGPSECVVVINVSDLRCDAFLIQSGDIDVMNLPDLTQQEIERAASRFRRGGNRQEALRVLRWLWDTAAERILTRIGASQNRTGEDYTEWPKVFWIPTGALRLLPIHASGYHSPGSYRSVLDRVISSYGLSVEEILHARKAKEAIPRSGDAKSSQTLQSKDSTSRLVIVSMETTPDSTRLPFAREEVREVCDMFPARIQRVMFDNPLRADLLHELRNCTIFHFAGHGKTDARNPSLSGLILSAPDGRGPLPLTVQDLQTLRFHERGRPLLAYLSACSTGRIEDNALANEGIHLMGACRLAGFRHVIGSLWEVSDRICVKIASIVYETMLGNGLDESSVATSLHHAIRTVRGGVLNADPSSQQGRDFGKRENHRMEVGPPLWATFIHIGV